MTLVYSVLGMGNHFVTLGAEAFLWLIMWDSYFICSCVCLCVLSQQNSHFVWPNYIWKLAFSIFKPTMLWIVSNSLKQPLQDCRLTVCIKCEKVHERALKAQAILQCDSPEPSQTYCQRTLNSVKSVRVNTGTGNKSCQLCCTAVSILWET